MFLLPCVCMHSRVVCLLVSVYMCTYVHMYNMYVNKNSLFSGLLLILKITCSVWYTACTLDKHIQMACQTCRSRPTDRGIPAFSLQQQALRSQNMALDISAGHHQCMCVQREDQVLVRCPRDTRPPCQLSACEGLVFESLTVQEVAIFEQHKQPW